MDTNKNVSELKEFLQYRDYIGGVIKTIEDNYGRPVDTDTLYEIHYANKLLGNLTINDITDTMTMNIYKDSKLIISNYLEEYDYSIDGCDNDIHKIDNLVASKPGGKDKCYIVIHKGYDKRGILFELISLNKSNILSTLYCLIIYGILLVAPMVWSEVVTARENSISSVVEGGFLGYIGVISSIVSFISGIVVFIICSFQLLQFTLSLSGIMILTSLMEQYQVKTDLYNMVYKRVIEFFKSLKQLCGKHGVFVDMDIPDSLLSIINKHETINNVKSYNRVLRNIAWLEYLRNNLKDSIYGTEISGIASKLNKSSNINLEHGDIQFSRDIIENLVEIEFIWDKTYNTLHIRL